MPAGDVELTELVADRDQRYRLESQVQYGGGALDGLTGAAIPTALLARLDGLRRFARAVTSAAQLPASRLVPANDGPDTLLRGDGLVIVAGVGVYAAHETGTASRSGSLRAWAAAPLERWTGFHSMYLDAPPPDVGDDGDSAAVESPYVLTPVQERAVVSSRRDPVTLISGAPGTGKSHKVVAMACDALAGGESVLIAAKSDATVDALLGLLERVPGPDPVVFGSNERREALAARLAANQLQPFADDRVTRAHDERTLARSAEASLTNAIRGRLRAETLVAAGDDSQDEARRCAPRLFDPAVDHAEAAWLLGGALVAGAWPRGVDIGRGGRYDSLGVTTAHLSPTWSAPSRRLAPRGSPRTSSPRAAWTCRRHGRSSGASVIGPGTPRASGWPPTADPTPASTDRPCPQSPPLPPPCGVDGRRGASNSAGSTTTGSHGRFRCGSAPCPT